MAILPFEIRGSYVLNLILLFCVAIEPYLLYVLFSGPLDLLNFASSVYALDAGAMMLILAGLVYLPLGEEKKRDTRRLPPPHLARLTRVMRAGTASGGVFTLSAL